ncbi:hypothetical protein DERP_013677 [Dermatophagoides pteronyssinus]|uniref:Uncharacterized protein n=1 Tax=Dermatophagoides pteronyssinus TaxID=6956 RepID=A0ABQ8JVK2_DERPT|nr:hypothetical protein DERP_013677 [Dermatophagoides pteronyssinus]
MAEISKNETSTTTTTATNSQLKCKCYKLYIETMSMEIDSKLLYQLNNEHLQKRRLKIESYQDSFVEIQLSLLTIENFDTIDPIENDHSLLKMLTTIGKTLNSIKTSQPSTSSSTLSKPNSTTTTTTKKMQNNQDFIFTFKQIIKQIDTIPTNSSETKHLDYLSAKIHNLPINNMERMDLMVDELYRILIESIYMNNFPLYLRLLFRILNISVKRPPQPQQQNGQQQSPQQQQQQNGQITKYSIRDSLMKKCDQIFFNKQQQQSNNSSFKMDANYSLTMEKLESYGSYLFETIVSERRNYLANIRLMSQLFRNNSFDQKRLYPYLKYLIIDNVGVHFYLECFIIMIVGIGVGPLSGLYKQKNWTIRYEIFNRFCLNKYHNLDQSIRNAAQFICQLEKRCWKFCNLHEQIPSNNGRNGFERSCANIAASLPHNSFVFKREHSNIERILQQNIGIRSQNDDSIV